jgi:AcrR family transcriptional regulator
MKQTRNINKQKIIQVALSILQTEGFEKLSMRNIAIKLGIKASSLYNHFANKTIIVKELQRHYSNPVNRIYNVNFEIITWQEFIKDYMNSIYKEFMARPYILEIFSKYSGENEFGAMVFEKYLTKMAEFGFSVEDAAYISNLIGIYIVGHCTFALGVLKQKLDAPETLKVSLLSSEYKLSAEFVNIGWFDLDKSYDFAVTSILEGIAKLRAESN